MAYVDGFVLPVPVKKLAAYTKMARAASKIWREHGALEFHECAGDDLDVKGMFTFTKLVRPKKGETVMFSWIMFKSRAHRDRVNAKVMKDPRIAAMCDKNNTPFDVMRMAYGGFRTVVDA